MSCKMVRTRRQTGWVVVVSLLVQVVVLNTLLVDGYNLDEKSPLQLRPTDQTDISFGFSLAHHFNVSQRGLLVGAPRANDTTTAPISATRPGALYSCNLDRERTKCEQLEVLVDEKYNPFVFNELKDFGGLGFSLATDGDKSIVVCAPRWHVLDKVRGGKVLDKPFGICFAGKAPDYNFTAFSPSSLSSAVKAEYSNNGSCQCGMSVAHVRGRNSVAIGSPGCWGWQGDTWEAGLDNLDKVSLMRRVGELPLSDFDLTYDRWSTGYNTVTNLYLGYSVASITYNEEPAIVSSMPRTSSVAEIKVKERDSVVGPIVYILEQDSVNKNKLTVLDKIKPSLDASFDQDKRFAFFGYSLATVDVNSDGLEDLVVGAPFYHNSTAYHDQGAIFVYMQRSFSLSGDVSQQQSSEMVKERDAPRRVGPENYGRFGSCVASVGDIDKDGFNDVAVGAPFLYEGGAVFIYMGSADGLEDIASQVIRASSLSKNLGIPLKEFGSAIGQHIPNESGQGYDVAVGAHTTDTVLVFRSKDVIKLTWQLTFSGSMDLTKDNCDYHHDRQTTSHPCVVATTCFIFTTNSASIITSDLEVDFQLTGDKTRLFFDSGSSELKFKVHLKKDTQKCHNSNIMARSKIQDAVKPFSILGEISMDDFITNQVMLDPHIPLKREEQLNIMVFCVNGSASQCQSQIFLTYTIVGNYTLSSTDPIEIAFVVENRGEAAYNTRLFGGGISCADSGDKRGVKCDFDQIFVRNSKIEFSLYLIPVQSFFSSLDTSHDDFFNVTASVTTISVLSNPDDAVKTFKIPITVSGSLDLTRQGSQPALVYYNSSSYFKRPMEARAVEELGPEIIHKYKIFNGNKFSVYRTQVVLVWPLLVDDKYLLYPTEYPGFSDVSQKCEYTGGMVNPFNLTGAESATPDVTMFTPATNMTPLIISDGNVPKSITSGKSTQYMMFICTFGELPEKEEVVISLKFRFVQRTIEENVSSWVQLQVLKMPLDAAPPPAYVSTVHTDVSYKLDSPEWCGFFKRNRVNTDQTTNGGGGEPEDDQTENEREEEDEDEDEDPATPHTPMYRETVNASEDFQFSRPSSMAAN
ncbi:Integrin alpha-PS2-like 1 [Homarus americanus]|uniref:Integrin alpha-PS2-like 1 n=1 Tax=Homarus americanus TaxID=6706 RepID=A0A8J5JHY0_HOMAM|nr:Integrin alpha-PS2-like 1 [Homarus americanus]